MLRKTIIVRVLQADYHLNVTQEYYEQWFEAAVKQCERMFAGKDLIVSHHRDGSVAHREPIQIVHLIDGAKSHVRRKTCAPSKDKPWYEMQRCVAVHEGAGCVFINGSASSA